MPPSKHLGNIVVGTILNTTGAQQAGQNVVNYTNTVISSLKRLRQLLQTQQGNAAANIKFDLDLKDLELLLKRRVALANLVSARQQQSAGGGFQLNAGVVNFAKSATQVLNTLSVTKPLGAQISSIAKDFSGLASTVGTSVSLITVGVNVLIQLGNTLADISERYNAILVSARRVSFMLYSDTSNAQQELRTAAADAHKFGMTLEEVLSYKERLARLSSLTEEINFSQFTDTALKMSLATGRSGEEIAANVARVVGMLRSGSGSARSLVSLGLSGDDINEILKLAKSGGSKRDEAINLLVETLNKRFGSVNVDEFITPAQRFQSELSATRNLTGESIPWVSWAWNAFKSLALKTVNYWALQRKTFDAVYGAADTKPTRPQDTDIRDYGVGLAWQTGILKRIDPTGEVGKGYNFKQLMSKADIAAINKEYNKRVSAVEQSVQLEAYHRSLLKSQNVVLLAQLKYFDMIAEAKREGNADLNQQITRQKVMFDMQVDFLSKMSKPLEDILHKGLFGIDEAYFSEFYTRINETADPQLYDKMLSVYQMTLNAQVAQGKLSYEEYLTKLRTLEIMRHKRDVILQNIRDQNELIKQFEEERRAEEEWNNKMDDFWRGSSRVRTIKEMTELRMLLDQALEEGMDADLARETYNEKMFALLQSGGLLNFKRAQSTPLPGLFTYGTADTLREVNRIQTFGTSRTSIDDMVKNIRDQLKLDAQANGLLEDIKQVLIEMSNKIPGAGK